MPQPIFDYRSPTTPADHRPQARRRRPPNRQVSIAAGMAVFVIALFNWTLVSAAHINGGWGYVSAAVLVGPVMNILLGLLSLVLAPLVSRVAHRASSWPFAVAAVSTAFAAIVFDFILLSSM